jgi:hypothetical protein
MVGTFGSGRRHVPRPTVERTPRIYIGDIARSLSTPRAREGSIRVVIDGAEMALDVKCDPRNYGGDGQWFFLCRACSKKVQHLYLRDDPRDERRLVCRRCAGPLTYASQRTNRRGLHRVRNLRRRLGAPVNILAPLPPRPRNVWAAAQYDRLVRELARAEALIAAELHAIVPRVRRRLRHEHSNRDARRT